MADRVTASNRSAPFTPAENVCLLEEFNSYKDILLGKFSLECNNKKKNVIWKEIAATVNRVNPTVDRSIKDVHKRYKNMVQDAKREMLRNAKTGSGGPRGEKLKDTTEMVLKIYGGQSPTFWGINCGRDGGLCLVNGGAASSPAQPRCAASSPAPPRCWRWQQHSRSREARARDSSQKENTGLMSIPSGGADMQTPVSLAPRGKVPGRKRGRPPIRKLELQSHYPEPLSPLKVPKKRGRKPGFKLKPRMVMSPLADSPPRSNVTPEPELSSIPQDAATVPHSTTPQPPPAETSMPDDFLCDPVDSKRYAVHPSDSAFSVMTTQFPPKRSYGYPLGMCRKASSPGGFQEEKWKSAYSPASEGGECRRALGEDPSRWGVEEVVWFIRDADPQALGPHADVFRKHEIDGDALLLLKSDMMMKYLGLKLGPALKLCYHIDKLRHSRS